MDVQLLSNLSALNLSHGQHEDMPGNPLGRGVVQVLFQAASDSLLERVKIAESLLHVDGLSTVDTRTALGSVVAVVLSAIVCMTVAHLLRRRPLPGKVPPTLTSPWSLPGDVFKFLYDGPNFVRAMAAQRDWRQPFGIRLGLKTIYVFLDADQVSKLFKSLTGGNSNGVVLHLVKSILGAPKEMVEILDQDTSGLMLQPRPPRNGRVVPPNERWMHLNYITAHKHIANRSVELSDVYFEKLERTMGADSRLTSQWYTGDDLWELVQDVAYTSSIAMLYGDQMLRLNADFVQQVKDYFANVPKMLRGYNRWLYPEPYRKRDEALASVTRWVRWVDEQRDAANGEVGWETYGSPFVKAFDSVQHGYPKPTLALRSSGFLGLVFGTNTNTGPSIFWTIYEVLRRPALLAEVRNVVRSNTDPSTGRLLPSLFKSPLLQSIFNETLRLHTHTIQVIEAEEDRTIGEWRVPKGSTIGMLSTVAAFNPKFWNTGKNNEYPLDDFWAERFIVDPSNPYSGPTRRTEPPMPSAQPTATEPYYSKAGLSGKFFPFSDGIALCPGRHVVEREAIVTLACFVQKLEFEFQEESPEVAQDLQFYPFGVLPPGEKLPYRVRRRDAVDESTG